MLMRSRFGSYIGLDIGQTILCAEVNSVYNCFNLGWRTGRGLCAGLDLRVFLCGAFGNWRLFVPLVYARPARRPFESE